MNSFDQMGSIFKPLQTSLPHSPNIPRNQPKTLISLGWQDLQPHPNFFFNRCPKKLIRKLRSSGEVGPQSSPNFSFHPHPQKLIGKLVSSGGLGPQSFPNFSFHSKVPCCEIPIDETDFLRNKIHLRHTSHSCSAGGARFFLPGCLV